MNSNIKTPRLLSSLTLGLALVGALGLALVPSASDAGESCSAKSFKFDEVKKACDKGGIKEAKEYMKSVVKKAKDAGKTVDGKKITCKSCHNDTDKYDLTDNAVEEFKKIK